LRVEAGAKADRLAGGRFERNEPFAANEPLRATLGPADRAELARENSADWPRARNCDWGGRFASNEVTRRESFRADAPEPLNLPAVFQAFLVGRLAPIEENEEKSREGEIWRPPEFRAEKELRVPGFPALQLFCKREPAENERPPPELAKAREPKAEEDEPREPPQPPVPLEPRDAPKDPPREKLIEWRDDPPPPA
jgi:hypothetical protein